MPRDLLDSLRDDHRLLRAEAAELEAVLRTPRPIITETMTVNHVVRMWPEARAVFRAFKIDCEADGILCLDELCWWRGLDVAVVLEALRQAPGVAGEGFTKREMANV